MVRRRIDRLLVSRGLVASRAEAQAAIAAGRVRVGDRIVVRPSEAVAEDAPIAAERSHPWVSRGGMKLAAALDAFAIDPSGRACLDLGASTGGFTDVLLARGARLVTAVDVGRGQLHPRLAADSRVVSREATDARALRPDDFAEPPSLMVADLAFISLGKAIGPALACLAPGADVVLLVKPQFEVGPARVGKGGLVAPHDAETSLAEVSAALARDHALTLRATIESPIRGGDGNREFLVHAVTRAPSPATPARAA
jgi:23S rRNA (cytidine1920-2'-O)/16S rRNA (cytidine1409-2'-O)-methyltransferase